MYQNIIFKKANVNHKKYLYSTLLIVFFLLFFIFLPKIANGSLINNIENCYPTDGPDKETGCIVCNKNSEQSLRYAYEQCRQTYFTKKQNEALESQVKLQGKMIEIIDSSLKPEGFWSKNMAAIFGLFGVLIGSFISFLFNKMINNNERMSIVAIQRKNLIYAPIYKELLQLKNYIDNNRAYFIRIINSKEHSDWDEEYYYDGKRRQSGFFIEWNDMKTDIRKDYIPLKIKESLEKVNNKLNIYNEEKLKIENIFKKESEKINNSYKNFHDKVYGNISGIGLSIPASYFKENADILIGIDDPEINQLVDILVSAFSEAIEKNNNKIADDIIEYIKELGDKPRY